MKMRSVMIGAANRAIIIQIYLAEHDFRLIMMERCAQNKHLPNYSSVRASASNPSHQRNEWGCRHCFRLNQTAIIHDKSSLAEYRQTLDAKYCNRGHCAANHAIRRTRQFN